MPVLKRLLEECFSPIGIATLLFCAGLLGRAFRRWAHLWPRLIFGGAAMYVIFLFTPLAEVLIADLERPYPPLLHAAPSGKVPYVVILSAYGEDHPQLPATMKIDPETTARMVEGIRLYRELPGSRLVFSGGIVREGDRPLANLMADFAKEMGIPDSDIIVEGRSQTTYENLVEVNKIIGGNPFLLVTSAYHLRRAMAVARKLGMNPLAAPAAIWAAQHYPAGMSWLQWIQNLGEALFKPSLHRLIYLQLAYHERLGYFWYRMLGRI